MEIKKIFSSTLRLTLALFIALVGLAAVIAIYVELDKYFTKKSNEKYTEVIEWQYESLPLDLKFLVKTKLIDSKLFVSLKADGYPEYFKNQDFWKSADKYQFFLVFRDSDEFEIYKKELQLNEMSKIVGDKNDEIGFRYQYSEYLDSLTYSKFKSPYMLWNFPTKIQKKEMPAIANQQVLPKARNADSSDHCAPNLSKEERLRRLALSGSVRQSGTNSYSVGLKTLSFYSDGGMIFCN